MIAKNITGSNPINNRIILGEQLPLYEPLSMVVCPSFVCNFKCNYCTQALPQEKRGYITSKQIMSLELFEKIVDDIKKFRKPLKRLSFAGLGEPLLNKNISEMIDYAKKARIAESVEITTNGLLLNKDLSDKLIAAELDMLRVSIQGTSDAKYKEVSSVEIKLSDMIRQLKYFMEHKKYTKVYVKIIDCALEDEDDKTVFLEKFGDCCDYIGIETLIENARDIDYKMINDKPNLQKNLFGNDVLISEICPQPFFTMMVSPGGEVSPCCSMVTPTVIGDLKLESVDEVWNGKKMKDFRKKTLEKRSLNGKICEKCDYYKYMMYQEDLLDPYVNKLKEIYG